MTRQDANIIIAKEILKACEDPKNKDIRFWQLLANMHVIMYETSKDYHGGMIPLVKDCHAEESVSTLIRILRKQ